MKRILFFILTAIFCISCNSEKRELIKDLKEGIEIYNIEECPKQIDAYTILTSVEVKNNYVVSNFTVDENYISVQLLNYNKDILKDQIKESLFTFDKNHEWTRSSLKSVEYGIKYVFKGHITGQTCIITFEHGEL